MDGKGKGVIVDQWKEVLRSMPALVTQVNASSVLVRMENGEVTFTLFPESFVIIFIGPESDHWQCLSLTN